MSKNPRKLIESGLGPVQRQILKKLAEKGAQTRNRIKENLKKDSKTVYPAFDSLEKKKLIRKVGMREYRNRKFEEYWLTDDGIIEAIISGANKTIIKEYSDAIDGTSQDKDLFFDLIGIFQSETLRTATTMYKAAEQGKYQLRTMPLSSEEKGKFMQVMSKNRLLRAAVKKGVEDYRQFLNGLEKG